MRRAGVRVACFSSNPADKLRCLPRHSQQARAAWRRECARRLTQSMANSASWAVPLNWGPFHRQFWSHSAAWGGGRGRRVGTGRRQEVSMPWLQHVRPAGPGPRSSQRTALRLGSARNPFAARTPTCIWFVGATTSNTSLPKRPPLRAHARCTVSALTTDTGGGNQHMSVRMGSSSVMSVWWGGRRVVEGWEGCEDVGVWGERAGLRAVRWVKPSRAARPRTPSARLTQAACPHRVPPLPANQPASHPTHTPATP